MLGVSDNNISSIAVYLLVFADKIGNILFGVFVPIGILMFVALAVTLLATSSFEKEQNSS